MLNLDVIAAADTRLTPYHYLAASGALTFDEAAQIRADFPDIHKPGAYPISRFEPRGTFQALLAELQSAELAMVLSRQLDVDLRGKLRKISIRKLLRPEDGGVGKDNPDALCTLYLFLDEDWDPDHGGAIRALNSGNDMADFAEEIAPIAGNVFAFANSADSFHGHLPFDGERYSIEVVFMGALDLDKTSGTGLTGLLKRLNPFAKR